MSNKMHSFISQILQLFTVIFLMVATFSYAMFQGGFVSWFIFYATVPFFMYSFLLTFVPIRIHHVQREITPTILQRGDTAEVTVRFRNRSWFPLLFVTVQEVGGDESFTQSQGQGSTIFFVGWKRKFEWTYTIEELNRGEITFQSLLFTFTDFFGWTIRKKIVSEEQRILVLPHITELDYKPLQLYSQGGFVSPFAFQKDTTNVASVRNYQAGDRFSWIHWKSFAKNATLQTKEFEDVQTNDVWLTIDRSTEKHFEEAVELAASIVQSVIHHRGNISFLSLGEQRFVSQNIKTSTHFDYVMNHLAIVKPDAKERLDVLLAKETQSIRSSTLLVITGQLNEQFLRNSAQFGRSIICLLIVESQDVEELTAVNIQRPNVKVVPIRRKEFRNVFTEVMKP